MKTILAPVESGFSGLPVVTRISGKRDGEFGHPDA